MLYKTVLDLLEALINGEVVAAIRQYKNPITTLNCKLIIYDKENTEALFCIKCIIKNESTAELHIVLEKYIDDNSR